MLRFLVIEGNVEASREAYRAGFGLSPSESYAAVLKHLAPDARCDIAFPADDGANLPDASELSAYDAAFITGSALHVYDRTPAVTRQLDLMAGLYDSGLPAFGSCWGLQVAAVAAGGEVGPNPEGREIGIARRIVPSRAGKEHPMLADRPEAFDAPAVHLDIVTVLPPGATVLASNAVTGVQAAEIRHGAGTFWGVQYHPEFSLAELASILRRRAAILVDEGFCRTEADALAYAEDLATLDRDPSRRDLAWRHGIDAQILDPGFRLSEIRNFIRHLILPQSRARAKAAAR